MKATITTEDLMEIIHEKEFPPNFKSEEGLSESIVQTEFKGAQAYLKESYFDGVAIGEGKYSFKDKFIIQGGIDTPILEMHFSLQGRSEGRISDLGGNYAMEVREHNLFYMVEPKGVFKFEENSHLEILEITFTPEYFKKFDNNDSRIIEQYMDAIEKQRPLFMPNNGKINPLMENTIRQILNCPYKGSVKRIMLESKILELLALQTESLEQTLNPNCTCGNIKKSEIEKLHHAKLLMEGRLDTPPTIYELSRIIGLNEFKLKSGFKQLFGNTVFGYISDYRLAIAREFILETDRSFAEISDMIGYSHQQHFSTAFKRKYGISPIDLRKGKSGYLSRV
ncbi:AraC-like DNA-binding protein [Algoriphagus sp. 4150]|uniref:helix-turn-helix transcriptional regulator n=1 Tax=Algoriphagus sp. 4150 TaxID=2817756 RepID=UPI00285E1EA8|nr:AraC family transcriptional regulator [Algoriphagus sp. 4150]MDR7131240.1 AraC-like DNA-binding protein [Algoriphagus sp. 4150]